MGGDARRFRDVVAHGFQTSLEFELVLAGELLVFQAEFDGRFLVRQHAEVVLARGQQALRSGQHFVAVGHFFMVVVQFILQKKYTPVCLVRHRGREAF